VTLSQESQRSPLRSDAIVRLHAGNPSPVTGWGNWTYYLPGRAPLLIDAGVGIETHLAAIAEVASAGPTHVVVTHAHGDHIGGVETISSRWPATRFSKIPWPERDEKYPAAWQSLSDGDVVPAGDGELEVVHTPGHAPDHIALWEPLTRTLFSGDLVVPGTTVVIPASMGGSLSAYLRSLERVLALEPLRLMPSHGAPVDDPRTLIRQYIEHRNEREQQILAGLEAGDRSVDALVARIYVGLKPALVPMANESVLAHLGKLRDDGIAHEDEHGWALY
jgi:glyoxylase-like metal-dependent hydrolase (beta-lactamase superfamily II)